MQAAADITPDDVPIETPAVAPADDIDSLLASFDSAVKREPEPAADTAQPNADAPPLDEVDAFIQGLNAPSADQQRADSLQGEVDSLRAAEFARQERSDFEGFSQRLQAECGVNVPDDYAKTQLLAMAAENPALEHAWRYRSLSDADRRAADAEFSQLEILYRQTQQAPDDPRKAEALAQMEQRAQQLGYMMNAPTMLNRAWRDVVKRASKVAPPVDELATGDHNAVAALVRGASAPLDLAEPAPKFGEMSDAEFREYSRKNFGF
jgi:hypothetical protein